MKISIQTDDSGCHVIVDDKWADCLGRDEALGVVASALFSDHVLYVRTTEEHARWNERYGQKVAGLLPAPKPAVTTSDLARQFMRELLGSVETLSGIAEEHGARTLADLMFLQQAILDDGFIDHYPGESKVLDIARSLPSGKQWEQFIEVEYMASEPETALEPASPVLR